MIAFRLTFATVSSTAAGNSGLLISLSWGNAVPATRPIARIAGNKFGNVLHDFTSGRLHDRVKNLKPRLIIPDFVKEAISLRKCSLCTLIPLLTEICAMAAS